jgi:predicted NBD/HSP70 family sugar kinase
MHYVGLDIGGTSLKAGLVDETGHVVESRKAPTATDDLNAFLFNVTELIREFQKSTEVEGVGMGVPGLRSARTHIIGTSPNIPCLKYVNLEQLVAEQVQVRCVRDAGP